MTGSDAASVAEATLGSRLELISDVTDRLVRTLEFDETLQILIEGATDLLGVARGSIMLLDEEAETLSIKVAKGIDVSIQEETCIPLGKGIAGGVAESGEPLVVEDVRQLPAWHETAPADQKSEYRDHSALSVPLKIHGAVRGVMNFNNKRDGTPLDGSDLGFALLIANQAAVALYTSSLHEQYLKKQALEYELDIARSIQQRLVPDAAPDLDGLDIGCASLMCHQVGGDYLDFVPLGDSRVAVAVGDVSGHGLGPALLVSDARASVRVGLQQGESLAECLYSLNKLLASQTGSEMFMTLVLGVLEPEGGRFRFATGGHHMPMVARDGELLEVPRHGANIPLGIRPDEEFEIETPLELEPGDVLLLFTDGLWEALDERGVRFGQGRLGEELCRLTAEETADDIVAGLLAATARHRIADEPQDDYTVVAIRVL